ncbi:hypothetical protein PMU66_00465 [Enterococcus durans]|nr:hypothetical protein [Enterococcus durans]MDB1651921.1 hypothetical protein [Enterococcus durans]MDB1656956.1 hypothetical protein [Enterococcus durans]MDB1662568.1 hypothetical protein [Enterococcus durans]MDB1668889.1 hypothetical protein [Enterococcus durans]MDB1670570.1 hypothetical protein [Enterococcus durans]
MWLKRDRFKNLAELNQTDREEMAKDTIETVKNNNLDTDVRLVVILEDRHVVPITNSNKVKNAVQKYLS